MKILLWQFLLNVVRKAQDLHDTEPVPQDGWFNNLVHPDWGAIDTQLIRRSPPAYADGVYELGGGNRPNPLDISIAAHRGPAGLGSARGRNAFLVFYGQQLVEEILDVQRPGCPFEYHNIPVPAGHLNYDASNRGNIEMPFLRTRFDSRTGNSPNNPRQQLNEVTPFIDGTLMYGAGKTVTDALREFRDGRLLADDSSKPISEQFPASNNIRIPYANPPPPRDHVLKPVTRFLRIGNIRGFENPFLLSFAVIWFRWHNHIAGQLKAQHPDWDDELLFNNARKRVIAHHQKISMYDWLPRWLNIDENNNIFQVQPYYRNISDPENVHPFNGYDTEVHPGISQEFQTAAMRFGHTLVTPGIWLRGDRNGANCNWKRIQATVDGGSRTVHALRLCNTYWNGQETVEPMLDDIIRGMTSTLAEKEDAIVVPDLIEHVFGSLDFSRRDLAALNIQRARDHGVTDYNSVREAFKLARITDWNDINNDPDVQNGPIARLRALYGNQSSVDDIDLFAGGMLETTLDGPGPLFKRILLDQFMRIRHGDRFWFENTEPRFRQFSDAEIQSIMQLTMKEILLNVTDINPNDIPDDVFLHNNVTDPCPQPMQIAADTLQLFNGFVVTENCTTLQHYDYFTGSSVSFITTFTSLALYVPGTYLIMVLMGVWRKKSMASARAKKQNTNGKGKVAPVSIQANKYEVNEWVGFREGIRAAVVFLDLKKHRILLKDFSDVVLRIYDIHKQQIVEICLAVNSNKSLICVRVQGYIDLVLRFEDVRERADFHADLVTFLTTLKVRHKKIDNMTEQSIFKMAKTKAMREKELSNFFRMFTQKVFEGRGDSKKEMTLQKMNLTKHEFAEVLGLRPESDFISYMFSSVDCNGSGFISFQEFLDFFFMMSEGDANEKAALMFKMYDIGGKDYITQSDFSKMIISLMDVSGTSAILSEMEINAMVKTIYENAGLGGKKGMNFATFQNIFLTKNYIPALQEAAIPLQGLEEVSEDEEDYPESKLERGKTFFNEKSELSPEKQKQALAALRRSKKILRRRSSTLQKEVPSYLKQKGFDIKTIDKPVDPSLFSQYMFAVKHFFETNRLQIFWLVLYSLVTAGIFAERAHYYSFEREHGGLRRIAGYGVSVTRGAASVMMFTYSSLMVTMCKNIITYFRETMLHRFIPFDSAHLFHKYIASVAVLFTVMHCVGHGFNLYHICTQPPADLGCLFREYFRATHVLPTFVYWAYGTITGMTGIILVIIVIVMVVYALPYGRKHLFNVFTFTHKLYILLYAFLVLHGLGRLVQSPLFQFFFIGPALLFMTDKMISLIRRKHEIKLIAAELLPSDVLSLTFKRPTDFQYISGQWVQIACQTLGSGEYHPFTLTSAPHEQSLSLHIRAVGPWTTNLRDFFAKDNTKDKTKIYLDGPFGEGHQDWYKYPVSVLVGGGIGVTPFASILKDVIHSASKQKDTIKCKKIYFLWVTRTQKQFEWFTDILREVEKNDKQNLVDVHIFITQFKHKYDLRTTMLYICERHFQKLAGKSLLTGLEAITHFGRPRFYDFFHSLINEHPKVSTIGVFSCGPLPMSLSVEKACSNVAKEQQRTAFKHHHENF